MITRVWLSGREIKITTRYSVHLCNFNTKWFDAGCFSPFNVSFFFLSLEDVLERLGEVYKGTFQAKEVRFMVLPTSPILKVTFSKIHPLIQFLFLQELYQLDIWASHWDTYTALLRPG